MKKLLIALISLIFLLGACGGNDEPVDPADQGPNETDNGTVDEGNGDTSSEGTYDATAAKQTYQATCSGCHGENLEGRGNFPAIKGANLTKDEVLTVLQEGKGVMQAGLVQDDEEEENLAEWVADQSK